MSEDLDHLRREWLTDPPSDVVRRGSVILRRFLAEQILQRAWKAFGRAGQPTIHAPNLDVLLPDRAAAMFFVAGGARFGGVYMSGIMMNRGTTATGVESPDGLSYPFPLTDYAESASVFAEGEVIKRREIVKYFAHYVGGAHLHLSSRVRAKEEAMVRRISKVEGRVQVQAPGAQLEGLYLELLSIGQAVATSKDIEGLHEEMRDFFRM